MEQSRQPREVLSRFSRDITHAAKCTSRAQLALDVVVKAYPLGVCRAALPSASQTRRDPSESKPFGHRAARSLLHAVERPTSIKEVFMAFEVSPNRSNASIAPVALRKSGVHRGGPGRSRSSTRPKTIMSTTDSKRPDPDDDATFIPWIPLVVPLLALLPTLAAYFIGWGVLASTH
jgi:hypothetical protein